MLFVDIKFSTFVAKLYSVSECGEFRDIPVGKISTPSEYRTRVHFYFDRKNRLNFFLTFNCSFVRLWKFIRDVIFFSISSWGKKNQFRKSQFVFQIYKVGT